MSESTTTITADLGDVEARLRTRLGDSVANMALTVLRDFLPVPVAPTWGSYAKTRLDEYGDAWVYKAVCEGDEIEDYGLLVCAGQDADEFVAFAEAVREFVNAREARS